MARQANAAAADWLDAYCWRCRSKDVLPSNDGRVLCGPCRRELFDAAGSSESPLGVVRRMYWESHVLERCWRCMDRPVDREDDLGLCPRCRKAPEELPGPAARSERRGGPPQARSSPTGRDPPHRTARW